MLVISVDLNYEWEGRTDSLHFVVMINEAIRDKEKVIGQSSQRP